MSILSRIAFLLFLSVKRKARVYNTPVKAALLRGETLPRAAAQYVHGGKAQHQPGKTGRSGSQHIIQVMGTQVDAAKAGRAYCHQFFIRANNALGDDFESLVPVLIVIRA